MKLQAERPGAFTVTLTSHELSALLAGARMSLSLMETDASGATEEARAALERVLGDFDRELARTRGGGGEPA
jgi:predicted DNA-binding transcriptional regulator YafY